MKGMIFVAACLAMMTAVQAETLPNLADRHVAKLGNCQGCHGAGMPKAGATVERRSALLATAVATKNSRRRQTTWKSTRTTRI